MKGTSEDSGHRSREELARKHQYVKSVKKPSMIRAD
jgi:hypothetical protein